MEARAAVQVADRTIETWSLPVPDRLGDDEALLAVEGSGMCGSDWKQYLGRLIPCYPVIDGHEIVGRIARIGPVAAGRLGVSVGDRIALEGTRPCGECISCRTGRWKHCERGTVYGLTSVTDGSGLNGGYAEYLVMRSNTRAYRMPDELSIQDAVFFNPLGSGFDWAVRLAGTQVGDTVLIMGPGQRGLSCVIAAREAGAARIIVCGRSHQPWKLEVARELGATHVIVNDQESVAERVREITGGEMADRAVDTTPDAIAPLEDCLAAVRSEATIVLTSRKSAEIPNFVGRIMARSLTVRGAMASSEWGKRQAIRVLAGHKYDLSRVHTHTLPIDQLDLAMRILGGEVPGEEGVHITVVPSQPAPVRDSP
jgi:threonine dehydrogenase-like Zn-dependent dehydrogenase